MPSPPPSTSRQDEEGARGGDEQRRLQDLGNVVSFGPTDMQLKNAQRERRGRRRSRRRQGRARVDEAQPSQPESRSSPSSEQRRLPRRGRRRRRRRLPSARRAAPPEAGHRRASRRAYRRRRRRRPCSPRSPLRRATSRTRRAGHGARDGVSPEADSIKRVEILSDAQKELRGAGCRGSAHRRLPARSRRARLGGAGAPVAARSCCRRWPPRSPRAVVGSLREGTEERRRCVRCQDMIGELTAALRETSLSASTRSSVLRSSGCARMPPLPRTQTAGEASSRR